MSPVNPKWPSFEEWQKFRQLKQDLPKIMARIREIFEHISEVMLIIAERAKEIVDRFEEWWMIWYGPASFRARRWAYLLMLTNKDPAREDE